MAIPSLAAARGGRDLAPPLGHPLFRIATLVTLARHLVLALGRIAGLVGLARLLLLLLLLLL
ncbi:MAG: hypothetical protein ACOC97_04050, partial [Myxococcota bacterium]